MTNECSSIADPALARAGSAYEAYDERRGGFDLQQRIALQQPPPRARRLPCERIVVIDQSEERIRLAAEAGFIGLLGDATSEEILTRACVG
ncbi:NAD-binding protein, partial [Azospirillum argentinense]